MGRRREKGEVREKWEKSERSEKRGERSEKKGREEEERHPPISGIPSFCLYVNFSNKMFSFSVCYFCQDNHCVDVLSVLDTENAKVRQATASETDMGGTEG